MGLRAGEIHAFVGENGAGKSTLAKLIAGVHTPTRGTIAVDGQPVYFYHPRAAADRGIALIHQEPLTFPDLTVAENIFIGRQPARGGWMRWREMQQESARLLETLGIALDPAAPVRGLSVADRQMLELAAALSQNARVLILDETTASLTPSEVQRLAAILRRLRDEGKAIAFIGHRMEEIFDFCDRITILRDGKVVGERLTAETNVDEILHLMVGRAVELLTERPESHSVSDAPIVEVVNLTRRRKFSEISFAVRPGEIVGLAGLVGAGRTDVARCLFGLLPPDSGEIRLGGKPVAIRSPQDALRLGIALVPEDRQTQGAFLPLSLWENATLATLAAGKTDTGCQRNGWLNDRAARTQTDTWLSRLSVRCRSGEQPISQLSGGNQQKVILARWLETNPRLLILDEPTRGIDVGAKAEVHRWITNLAAEGMAVLLISSDLPEVLALSNRILVLRAGKIVREFPGAEATPEAVIAAASGITVAEAAA